MNSVSRKEPDEYSQPKKTKFKKEKNISIVIPERPKILTGDDYAKITGDIPLSPLTRSRSVAPNGFAEMEKDYYNFITKNNDVKYKSCMKNKKQTMIKSSNKVGAFESFYRYIRNKFIR